VPVQSLKKEEGNDNHLCYDTESSVKQQQTNEELEGGPLSFLSILVVKDLYIIRCSLFSTYENEAQCRTLWQLMLLINYIQTYFEIFITLQISTIQQ